MNFYKREAYKEVIIDKLAQRMNNSDKNNTPSRDSRYDELLRDMRKLNLKNLESADRLSEIVSRNEDSSIKLGELVDMGIENNLRKSEELSKQQVQEILDGTAELVHNENVKVYCNIKQNMKNELDTLKSDITCKIKDAIDSSTSVAEEKAPVKQKNTFLNVMSILIFIGVLADIALRVLEILGIL